MLIINLLQNLSQEIVAFENAPTAMITFGLVQEDEVSALDTPDHIVPSQFSVL